MTPTQRPQKTKTSLTIDPAVWRRFRARSVMEGRPTHETLPDAMEAYLRQPLKVKKEGRT